MPSLAFGLVRCELSVLLAGFYHRVNSRKSWKGILFVGESNSRWKRICAGISSSHSSAPRRDAQAPTPALISALRL